MPQWEDEMKRLHALIRENRKRIAQSRKVIAEFRATLKKVRLDNQPRRDALNPKIIRLPLPPKATDQTASRRKGSGKNK